MSIKSKSIEIREATTKYMEIPCTDKTTGEPFDFTGYTVQTWLRFGETGAYIPTNIDGNVVSYEIPATASVGAESGLAETRIFKGSAVFEVLRVEIAVYDADKPDTTPGSNG